MAEAPASNTEEIRYCVTGFVDLQGFSSHLEVSGNDLRTHIGKEAVQRLGTLVDATHLLEAERKRLSTEYPAGLNTMRVNDALIFTIDLPPLLTPKIGDTVTRGLSVSEMEQQFDLEAYKDADEFMIAYNARFTESLADLFKFVGLLARLHGYINRKEAETFYPGAKTVIAAGYRRPFVIDGKEDFFAANFSWSNAYSAANQLHGAKLFIDNSILQMLCVNPYGRNILRHACAVYQQPVFDPLKEYEDVLCIRGESAQPPPVTVSVLRREFIFREMSQRPLTYLQIVPRLMPFLEGQSTPKATGFWLKLFETIKTGKASMGLFALSDIEHDITLLTTAIETGDKARTDDLTTMAIQMDTGVTHAGPAGSHCESKST